MTICHYIESYNHPVNGRVSVFQRGDYYYELARGARHLLFLQMSLDEVRAKLAAEDYVLCEVSHV